MANQPLPRLFRADDFRLRRGRQNFRQSAGMIHFDMIDDNLGNRARFGHLTDMPQKIGCKRLFDGVHKGQALIIDEICIICGASRRLITVKITHIVVYGSNPVNLVFDFQNAHDFISSVTGPVPFSSSAEFFITGPETSFSRIKPDSSP